MTKIKGTPREGLIGATVGFFIGFAAVALFGPTANKFKEVMGLSPLMVGFLVAVPSLSGSLLRIPFSAWVDTTGGRKPFLVLLSLSILGMAGLTAVVILLYPDRLSASLYPLLLVLGVLSGCGIATFSPGISQVSYWFPQARQGSALGAFAGVGNLAPGLFSLLLPLALSGLGLGTSYLIWLVFLILGTGLLSPSQLPLFSIFAKWDVTEKSA
jgi:NNP family nitrate/nitrite transporter-like MFS transporter